MPSYAVFNNSCSSPSMCRFLFDGGFWDCFRYTVLDYCIVLESLYLILFHSVQVKTKGPRALWRGFGTCVARAFPANAGGFLAYEMALKFMRKLDTEMAPA